ncbi:MAG TPA: hypothetical protein VLW85_17815 [Myxococcales bacterium]|nr:hypothetical protein [Myxococcales bacterium]
MRRFAALWLCAGCALPVVSAGTFLPAGDLQPGEFHASASLEAGRVLAGPSDVHDLPATPPDARSFDVSTWIASDLSLRWQQSRRLTLEGQLKFTNPVVPFEPALVGGAVGARLRLKEHSAGGDLALELGARAVGVGVQQSITRSADGRTQVDQWSYRSFGFEVPLIASYRVNPLFAVTASPFLRAYWIRAWHDQRETVTATDGTVTALPQTQAALQWSPVLSGGVGVSAAFDLGPVQIAPNVALELATRPGPQAVTQVLFEPGVAVGTKF